MAGGVSVCAIGRTRAGKKVARFGKTPKSTGDLLLLRLNFSVVLKTNRLSSERKVSREEVQKKKKKKFKLP